MTDDASGHTPLLQLSGLTKSFPGVKAVDDVSFDIAGGTIHALLGENGAGKSTLVKMIYGVLQPDAGTMHVAGAPYQPRKPVDARAKKIGMVFQHFSLFDALTVTENVALGIDGADVSDALKRRIIEVSHTYGLDLEPERLIGSLSVGERQRIEIVRCLLQAPRLIIMDEPTSVLTPQEANKLFETLRRLASEGRSILYISHKLEEIRSLCSKATVLRGGRRVAECDPSRETAKSLAEMMIGTTLKAPQRTQSGHGPARLKLCGLDLAATHPFGTSLVGVSLEVHGGEVVGIAGVAGNGQVELMAALIGERPVENDEILLDDAAIGRAGPNARRAAGLAAVPEERLGHGAVPNLSLTENTLLSADARGMLDWTQVKSRAEAIVKAFGVKTAGVDRPARSLSGGNLQKFIVGREVMKAPKVFIASQPTWGVDAGAAALIHEQLLTLAANGTAVLLISQDLDELFALSHRIGVLAGGRLSPVRPVESLTIETIGREMGAAAHA